MDSEDSWNTSCDKADEKILERLKTDSKFASRFASKLASKIASREVSRQGSRRASPERSRETSRQASPEASPERSKQASKQVSRSPSKQASKQVSRSHSPCKPRLPIIEECFSPSRKSSLVQQAPSVQPSTVHQPSSVQPYGQLPYLVPPQEYDHIQQRDRINVPYVHRNDAMKMVFFDGKQSVYIETPAGQSSFGFNNGTCSFKVSN